LIKLDQKCELIPDDFLALRQNCFRIHSGADTTFVATLLASSTIGDSDDAISAELAFEIQILGVLKIFRINKHELHKKTDCST